MIAAARSALKWGGSTGSNGLSGCCSSGTRIPVSPSATASGMPPTLLATTGVPQAIASRLMMPKGS